MSPPSDSSTACFFWNPTVPSTVAWSATPPSLSTPFPFPPSSPNASALSLSFPRIFDPWFSSSLDEYSQGQGVWCGGVGGARGEVFYAQFDRLVFDRPSPPPPSSSVGSTMGVRGTKKHLKRLNAPKHWMLDKLGGIFVRGETRHGDPREKKGRPPPSAVEPRARMQDRDAIGERNRRTETIDPTAGQEGRRKCERLFQAWGFETSDRVWPGCLGEKEPAKEARRKIC